MKGTWFRYVSIAFAAVMLLATVGGGSAHAKKSFQQKLDDATIGSTQIDDGSIGCADLSPTVGDCPDADGGSGVGNEVTGDEIANNTVTGDDVDESTLNCTGPGGIPGCGGAAPGFANIVLGPAQTSTFGAGQTGDNGRPIFAQVTSACPAGSKVVGGNVSWNDGAQDAVYISESRVSGNGWTAKGSVDEDGGATLTVQAICIQ